MRSARFRKQEIQCQYLGEDTAKSRESCESPDILSIRQSYLTLFQLHAAASQVSSPTSPVDTLQVDSPAPSTSSVSTAQRVPTPPQAVNNAVPALSPRPWTSAPEGYIVYAVPFNFSHQLDPPLSIPWTFIPSQPQSSIPFSSAFMHELASATSAPFVPFPAPASPRINPPATTSPLMTQSNCLTGILNSHVTNEDLAATLPEFSEPVSSESHQRISVDRFNSSPTDGSTSQTPYDDPSTTTTFGAGSFDLERPEFSFDSFTLEDDATPTKDAMNRGGADV